MMQQARYDGLATQQAAHKSFVDKVTDIQRRLKDGKLVVSMEMTGFLKSWLTEHILKLDTKYSESMAAASIRVGGHGRTRLRSTRTSVVRAPRPHGVTRRGCVTRCRRWRMARASWRGPGPSQPPRRSGSLP